MSRTLITAALGVAVLAFSASAALFTTQLDEIQAVVQMRQDELPDKLTRAQKKEAAAYKSVLKKLSKDSVSLKTDLKVAKVALKLERLKDEQFDGLLDSALAGFISEVQGRIDNAQQRLNFGAPAKRKKVTPEKVQKALDKATTRMGQAADALKRKKVVARLLQANASATQAEKLLDKLGFTGDPGGGGGGGGGGGQCGGTPFGASDAGGGVFGAGAQWTGEEYATDDSSGRLVVTIFDCDGFGGREYKITMPATLELGQYDALATGASLEVSDLGGSGTPIMQGQITINQADTRLQVSYVFNGEISYQGGFSIPLVQ